MNFSNLPMGKKGTPVPSSSFNTSSQPSTKAAFSRWEIQHVGKENKKGYSDNLFLINFGYSTNRFLPNFGYSVNRLILIFQAADRDNENAVLLTIGVLSNSRKDHLKRRFLHFAGIDLICQRVQGFHTFFNELLAS